MNFEKAFKLMKAGEKVKLTTWSGYWYWDNEKKTIMIHTRFGEELDIRQTDRVEYTFMHMQKKNWEIADKTNCEVLGGTPTFCFEEAIRLLKKGKKITRLKWKDLKPMGIDVYIIKDHHNPERFSLDYNQLPETDAIYKVSGTSKKIYNPSPMDIFANDWTYVGNE